MPFEPPSGDNSYVLDTESATEQVRILHQDRMATRCMGGPIAEQEKSVVEQMSAILDIACGPGAWVLDMAYEYPSVQITGIDISQRMLQYAQELAASQGLQNATFLNMNALEPLRFGDNSFDLVNARALFGFMSKAAWPALAGECMRILKPGGILRLTEIEYGISNGPASEKMSSIFLKALHMTGRSYSPDGRNLGITPMLAYFLREAGFTRIQKKPYLIDASYGSEDHDTQFQNIAMVTKGLKPFLNHLGIITDAEFEQLYQQSLDEMGAETFCSLWYFMTAWGHKPT